jgi:hypothetical protein
MRLASSLSIGIVLAACGGGGGRDRGTVSEAAAQMSVEETGVIVDGMAAADGPMVAGGVVDFFAASQLIISPAVGRIGPGAALRPAIVGTATCTPVMNEMSTCTFDLYGDDTPGSSYMLDGTVRKDMDTYTFDMTYDVATETNTYHWVMTGSMITTPTTLDGLIRLDGDGTTPIGDVHWELSIEYRDIELGANRCPRNGNVYVISIYSSEGNEIFNIDGDLLFALVCA